MCDLEQKRRQAAVTIVQYCLDNPLVYRNHTEVWGIFKELKDRIPDDALTTAFCVFIWLAKGQFSDMQLREFAKHFGGAEPDVTSHIHGLASVTHNMEACR